MDLTGLKFSLFGKCLGLSVVSASVLAFLGGAYSGCREDDLSIASRHASIGWKDDELTLCVVQGDRATHFGAYSEVNGNGCPARKALLTGVDFYSHIQQSFCSHRGLWIWGVCHSFDLGRRLTEHELDVKAVDATALWRSALLSVGSRCNGSILMHSNDPAQIDPLVEYVKSHRRLFEAGDWFAAQLVMRGCFGEANCLENMIYLQNIALALWRTDAAAAFSILGTLPPPASCRPLPTPWDRRVRPTATLGDNAGN